MMKARALFVILLAMPLAGCSSFFGLHPFARHVPKPAIRVAQQAAGDAETQLGREQLAASAPGAAIEHFRKALSQGEPIAPAVNGLGVAYAMIGREDLARRFFEEARTLDPGNEKYAGNLAMLASRAMTAPASMLAASVAPAPAPSRPISPASTLTSARLERLSRSEVRIVSGPSLTAPIIRQATANASSEGRTVIRMAAADPRPQVMTKAMLRAPIHTDSAASRGSAR